MTCQKPRRPLFLLLHEVALFRGRFVANLMDYCPSIQKGPGTMSPVNSRREMLTRASCGFGALALQAMLADTTVGRRWGCGIAGLAVQQHITA
jgi:hypothetical protein